jgi:hypothetical protein
MPTVANLHDDDASINGDDDRDGPARRVPANVLALNVGLCGK